MKLKLFTACYPYGFGESFINNELAVLKNEFEAVKIYPFEAKGNLQTDYPGGCEIKSDDNKLNQTLTFGDRLFILKTLFSEWSNIKQKGFFLKRIRRFAAILKRGVLLSKWLDNQAFDKDEVIYSFWMNEWALALAILKKRGKDIKFAFRVNGYDIHDDRHEGNYLPFRHFVYTQTEKVYPLSKTSQKHIQDLNIFPEKIDFSYFGTLDMGELDSKPDDKFTVFTCSSAIPLKRLEKIAEVIKLLPFEVRWAHHGGGPTLEKVKQSMETAPENVHFQYTEKVDDYKEVYEIQRRLCPDVFINLSTSEGLPVTIMETMSFGVPIVVNDVGSCAEFINETTGALVSADASPKEIAEVLIRFKETNKSEKDRMAIKKFWEENFSAEKNYVKFADKLKALYE